MPKITGSAEKAAERFVKDDATLVLAGDGGFVSEAYGRASGLMDVEAWTGKEGHESVYLFALRPNALDEDFKRIKQITAAGDQVIVFGRETLLAEARKAGVTAMAEVETHAAPNGGLFQAKDANWVVPTDSIALVVAEWTWTGEFVAACTRLGKMPAMWKSLGAEGGKEWAAKYKGKRFHDHAVSVVGPGVAGKAFLTTLRKNLQDLYEKEQDKILEVAAWAAQAIKDGKGVYTFALGHGIGSHTGCPNDPKYFRQICQGWFDEDPAVTIKPGDVLFFIGQGGLPIEWGGFEKKDLPGKWRKQGARLAWSFGNLQTKEFERHKAMIPQNELFIDQHFAFADGLVNIPGFEIAILPGSGITSEAVLWTATAAVHSQKNE